VDSLLKPNSKAAPQAKIANQLSQTDFPPPAFKHRHREAIKIAGRKSMNIVKYLYFETLD
jgi:hypothetical protein